ncbi:hypothetical protein [Fodinicola acaciae]|uniref:hypothetical protein n=1 Tax=Fodinicola acaciae TaxID=2681555 RepID=UPI0013D674D8|nr:hypothetical protein [Fodinicola acaciae]
MEGRPKPVFAGAHALLTMIQDLCRRPAFFSRGAEKRIWGDQPLPLVCLRGEPGSSAFLNALDAELSEVEAPHVRVDAATAAAQSASRWASTDPATPSRQVPLLPLLDELSVKLAATSFGGARVTRFDHYRLADWLTGQNLPPAHGRDDRAGVIQLLRGWIGQRKRPELVPDNEIVDIAPGWPAKLGLRIALWLGRRVGYRWFSDRVPGLGRETRWFMRQQFMVPRHSVGFLGFAERLTAGRRDSENKEQLDRLLVHAFLEDLRIAYRRRHFKIFPRRRGWRRTSYVIVLLDNVTATNGGWDLLRLINDVRNETGELDPMLVVAASVEPPPPYVQVGAVPPAEAITALRMWRQRLPVRRQLLTSDARYLVVTVPAPSEPATLDGNDSGAWSTGDAFRSRRPPLLARRGIVESVAVVLVTAALVPAAIRAERYDSAGCSLFGSAIPGVSVRPAQVEAGDSQCVGYSDNSAQLFGTDPRLRRAELGVFDQNRTAERLHDEDPDRPFVSVVYFAGLTHRDVDPNTDQSWAEELEGVLLRQRLQNVMSRSEPLLRVIVANGGNAMKDSPAVVRDMLAPLFRSDPTIVGVIGLDRTVTETEEAIGELGVLGMPAVGTTLTGPQLTDLSPLYFQLSPGNAREAELVAAYAKHVHARRVTTYHPPLTSGDTYVRSLVELVTASLRSTGVPTADIGWQGAVSDLSSLCRSPGDRSDEIVFFAGRDDDFGDFIRTVTRGCYRRDQLPLILGDDAVSRFVEHEQDRTQDALAGVPVSYVTLASLAVLSGPSCVNGMPLPADGGGTPLAAFCAGYHTLRQELARELTGKDAPSLPWPGERIGQAYDASGLFVDAVTEMQRRGRRSGQPYEPNPGALAQQLRETVFLGATGTIDFGRSRSGDNRNIAILRLADLRDISATPTCLYLIGDLYEQGQRRGANGCPVH